MRTQRSLTALIKEPTTSGILVTNTSGGALSVSVWDLYIHTQWATTSAVAAESDISLQIDGVIVVKFNVVFENGTFNGTADFHHNAGGQQFLLANTHTITINQFCPANTFIRTACNVAVDFVAGS